MLTQNCECIKVTYTLVGEEPVTVEVEKDRSGSFLPFYINVPLIFITGVWIEFIDNEWIVSTGMASPTTLQATLSEDTPCPFGVYTIEEGSIFESFIVEPCTIPNPYVESINCYKLAVWSKQCEYSKCVLEYVNNLIFGIDVCKLEESLKEQRRVLEILNCYDPRDIPNNTVIYNTIPYGTIKKLLYK
jgi:hypothetical protein